MDEINVRLISAVCETGAIWPPLGNVDKSSGNIMKSSCMTFNYSQISILDSYDSYFV